MNKSSIIMYTTEDGLTKIETTFDEDTVWLSLDQMAELFQRDKSTISRHIKNIFQEGELDRNSVVANFATTATDGKTYQVDYYNLDVIISVGYRVKSLRGTQFRIWAMGILKEYMKKGFALDDDRLKRLGGGNYFDELLARIRDIRSSEKVFWRKVLEIYATSIDMILVQKVLFSSLSRYRIKCTGPLTNILLRKLSLNVQMRKKKIWDSPHGNMMKFIVQMLKLLKIILLSKSWMLLIRLLLHTLILQKYTPLTRSLCI